MEHIGDSATLYTSDCLDVLPTLEANSVDAVVTDPPYGLSFMGKAWDKGVPSVDIWREVLRVLKPGGHLLAFSGTRTQHRMASAIEDAGFEIRDMIAWVYGSGFPKSLDVSKAIDKTNGEAGRLHKFTAWMRTTGLKSSEINRITETNMGGHYLTSVSQPAIPTAALWEKLRPHCGDVPEWVDELVQRIEAEREVVQERKATDRRGDGTVVGLGHSGNADITAPATEAAQQWQGWGTALKPALEPITVARKPLNGTVAANVLEHGTGAINVDACRVAFGNTTEENHTKAQYARQAKSGARYFNQEGDAVTFNYNSKQPKGRWPANLIHDGSDEVVRLFPVTTSGSMNGTICGQGTDVGGWGKKAKPTIWQGDSGSAARFFYCAKSSKRDRNEGLDKVVLIDIESLTCEENTTSSEKLARLLVATEPLPPRVTAEYGTGNKSVTEWSITLFGKALKEQYPTANKSTTSTVTSSTIESRILNSLTRYITSASIPGVSLETENGGSCAASAENSNTLTITISEKMALALGVKSARNGTRLRISASEGRNAHSTVKPTDLMRYLVRLVTPLGGTVLDPYTGSGSTGKACVYEGFYFVGIDIDPEYVEIAKSRIQHAIDNPEEEQDKSLDLFS